VLTLQNIGDHLRSGGSVVTVVAKTPRGQRRRRRQGRAVELDRRAGQPLRHPRHHRQHRRLRPQRRPELRRAEQHAAVGGRRAGAAGAVPDDPAARHITGQTLHVGRGAWPTSAESFTRRSHRVITVEPVTIRLHSDPQLLLRHRRRRLFPTVIAQAREAEAAGFDSVFLMDHFYQLPMLGTPDQPMLEAYTALGRWPRPPNGSAGHAGHRQHLPQPDAAGQGHHHPGRGQRGRAILGMGTGWFELEHEQLGFEFGTFTERFDKLEEALQIILPMLAGER
jgi:hypothetical protein